MRIQGYVTRKLLARMEVPSRFAAFSLSWYIETFNLPPPLDLLIFYCWHGRKKVFVSAIFKPKITVLILIKWIPEQKSLFRATFLEATLFHKKQWSKKFLLFLIIFSTFFLFRNWTKNWKVKTTTISVISIKFDVSTSKIRNKKNQENTQLKLQNFTLRLEIMENQLLKRMSYSIEVKFQHFETLRVVHHHTKFDSATYLLNACYKKTIKQLKSSSMYNTERNHWFEDIDCICALVQISFLFTIVF